MPTATPTTLDQITAAKTKLSERLARLDADREKAASQLHELETAERVLSRVGSTPAARRPRSGRAAGASASTSTSISASTSTRGRSRPPRQAPSAPAGRKTGAPTLGERVLALANGRTRRELYSACPNDRPNHVAIVVQRHIRAGRIEERDGKLYAKPNAA